MFSDVHTSCIHIEAACPPGENIVMRLSSSFVAPSVVAIVSSIAGNVANRNRPGLLTSERHGRCAEAGEAICAEAAGKYRWISPDVINRTVNSSNAIGRAEFSARENCQA